MGTWTPVVSQEPRNAWSMLQPHASDKRTMRPSPLIEELQKLVHNGLNLNELVENSDSRVDEAIRAGAVSAREETNSPPRHDAALVRLSNYKPGQYLKAIHESCNPEPQRVSIPADTQSPERDGGVRDYVGHRTRNAEERTSNRNLPNYLRAAAICREERFAKGLEKEELGIWKRLDHELDPGFHSERIRAKFMCKSNSTEAPSLESVDLNKKPSHTFIFQAVMSPTHVEGSKAIDLAIDLAVRLIDVEGGPEYLAKIMQELAKNYDSNGSAGRISSLKRSSTVKGVSPHSDSHILDTVRRFVTDLIGRLDDNKKATLFNQLKQGYLFKAGKLSSFAKLTLNAFGDFCNIDFIRQCIHSRNYPMLARSLQHSLNDKESVTAATRLAFAAKTLVDTTESLEQQNLHNKNDLDKALCSVITKALGSLESEARSTFIINIIDSQITATKLFEAQLPRAAMALLIATQQNSLPDELDSFDKALEHTGQITQEDKSLFDRLLALMKTKRSSDQLTVNEWCRLIACGYFNDNHGLITDKALQYFTDSKFQNPHTFKAATLADLLKAVPAHTLDPDNSANMQKLADLNARQAASSILTRMDVAAKIELLNESILIDKTGKYENEGIECSKVIVATLNSFNSAEDKVALNSWLEQKQNNQKTEGNIFLHYISYNKPEVVKALLEHGYKVSRDEERDIASYVTLNRGTLEHQQPSLLKTLRNNNLCS